MRKIIFFTFFLLYMVSGFSCDQTSVTVLSATDDGSGEITYTAQVCLGISPNWGSTDAFTLVATGGNITGTTTTLTSTYNYCSVDIAFNGAGCAVSSMGQPPAGGTIQTANVTASSSTAGGDLTFTAPGTSWLAPDDLRGDCADCGNPSQLCWTIEFTTDAQITALQLTDAEGDATVCPDEVDATVPVPIVCIPADLQANVNGTTSITVCENDPLALDLGSTCSTCVIGGMGQTTYSWSGPGGYSSTSSDPGAFTPTAADAGTYTLSGQTNGCPTQTSSVTVNVNALPTGTLGTPALDDCNSVSVPISFTGTGAWTFTYQIDGVSQAPITTSTNPYNLVISSSGTITLNPATGVQSPACAGAGAVSGSTAVSISAVNAAAGSDFTPLPDTDITIDATGTAGNDGYDTVTTAVNGSNSTSGTINDGTTFNAGSILLSGITNNCPMDINNLTTTPVCFWYTNDRAGSQLTADLCMDAGMTNCISVPLGGIPNSTKSMGAAVSTEYCFAYGDVLNLISGEPCNSRLYLQVTDVGGGNDGTFDGWNTSFQDLDLTIRPNPSYSWTVLSGGANLSYLSSTTIEDPVFNAPNGTAAGCYTLTVTDGAGCTSTDDVCFSEIILALDLMQFDASVNDRQVHLVWEMLELRKDRKYFVQRSLDGIEFVTISEAVIPNETGIYRYVDVDPLSAAYYRLKEVTETGGIDHSVTRYVTLKEEESLQILHIYPQPLIGDQLKVSVLSGKEQEAMIRLYNVQGQIVFDRAVHLLQGATTLDLKTDNAYSGMYSLELVTENTRLFARVNKQ